MTEKKGNRGRKEEKERQETVVRQTCLFIVSLTSLTNLIINNLFMQKFINTLYIN